MEMSQQEPVYTMAASSAMAIRMGMTIAAGSRLRLRGMGRDAGRRLPDAGRAAWGRGADVCPFAPEGAAPCLGTSGLR